MATYAVGDIHGCMAEFELLLERINFVPSKDRLWLVGDIVNRGKNSLEVLRYAYNNQAYVQIVLGNHDFHLLSIASGARHAKRNDSLQNVLQAPDRYILIDWLRQQPVLVVDDRMNFAMSHAGVAPWWNLAKAKQEAKFVQNAMASDNWQDVMYYGFGNEPSTEKSIKTDEDRVRFGINVFTRMRFVKDKSLEFDGKSSIDSAPAGFKPWFSETLAFKEETQVVFGHWAALEGVTNTPGIYALDTGCSWGGRLTAMCLETKEIFTVESMA